MISGGSGLQISSQSYPSASCSFAERTLSRDNERLPGEEGVRFYIAVAKSFLASGDLQSLVRSVVRPVCAVPFASLVFRLFPIRYFESESVMETKDVLDLRKTKAAGMGDPNKLDAVQPNCLYGYGLMPPCTSKLVTSFVTPFCTVVLHTDREFWVDLDDRIYELRAPTNLEAQVWVQYLQAYAGCTKQDGTLKKVPIPSPLLKGMFACLAYLLQHGTRWLLRFFFRVCHSIV